MKKIATYTTEGNRKIFACEIDEVAFTVGEEVHYGKIANSTYTLPKVQANENQILVLENEGTEKEAWILQDKVLQGTFYEKQGGKMENEIFVRDISRFTQIPPLEFYDDGTTQNFNETLQAWEYSNKGGTLLEKELAQRLESAKIERLKQLESDWQASKLIVIQNGNTIIIKHDTEERKIFLDNIELVKNESTKSNTVLSYRQVDKENKCRYSITLVYYIWKYLFADSFLFVGASGFEESVRSKNEGEYTLAKLKIENATTTDGVNNVVYDFINPQGIVIDISVKAEEMLANTETPEAIKQMILFEKEKDPNGEIHLIKKEKCQ